MGDFARLNIPKRYKEFTSISSLTRMPKVTFVAKQMTNEQIHCLAGFRREGRFPTVTYVHQNVDGKVGEGCSLWRSSEPTNTLLVSGCADDRLNFLEMAR